MLGHRRLRKRQFAYQIAAHALGALRQEAQDFKPGRMPECLEHSGHSHGLLIKGSNTGYRVDRFQEGVGLLAGSASTVSSYNYDKSTKVPLFFP